MRPRAPSPERLAVRTPVRRSRGIPIVGRLLLVIAVIGLGAGVLYLGAGGLTTVAGMVGSTLTGFVEDVTATPSPTPTEVPAVTTPSVAAPAEPYTNQESVDLVVTVPKAFAGKPEYRILVYLALEGQQAVPIADAPIARGARTIIPVELTPGINDFTVTLTGPGGESAESAVVRYVLDTKEPAIKISSPRDGATVNRAAVPIEGRSQGRSTLIARNQTTGDSIAVTADPDGRFKLSLPIALGGNRIVISATDPAGNVNQITLDVARGSGRLRASLSASPYSVKRAELPEPVRLTVTVDDPDGRPLAGAKVTFTLSLPGLSAVTGDSITDANGRAVFQTTIPKGADVGGGTAGVFVRTGEFGNTTDETVVTIRK